MVRLEFVVAFRSKSLSPLIVTSPLAADKRATMLKHIPFYATLLNKDLGKGRLSSHTHVLVYGAIEAHSWGARGCIASNKRIAEETGLSVSRVKSLISELAAAGWITVTLDDNRNRLGIVPHALGYDSSGTGGADSGTGGVPVAATEYTVLENTVNNKRGLDSQIEQQPPQLHEALRDLVDYRKTTKRPMTPKALVLALKQLQRLHPDDLPSQVLAIEQTIANGWSGVYRLQGESGPPGDDRAERYRKALEEYNRDTKN